MPLLVAAVVLTVGVPQETAAQTATAYDALRTLSEQRGDDVLSRILRISGIQGTTQPLVWKIVVDDSSARGGYREYEISGGSILSERTPVAVAGERPPTIPLRMDQLNLDSDGAFTVANQAAQSERIGFDSANYELYSRDGLGVPQWTVELVGVDGQSVGVVEIAANDGSLIRAFRDESGAQTVDRDEGVGGALGQARDAIHGAGRATRDTFLRGAGAVQEWLTGRRTIDRSVDD